jgi:hypothetical protein
MGEGEGVNYRCVVGLFVEGVCDCECGQHLKYEDSEAKIEAAQELHFETLLKSSRRKMAMATAAAAEGVLSFGVTVEAETGFLVGMVRKPMISAERGGASTDTQGNMYIELDYRSSVHMASAEWHVRAPVDATYRVEVRYSNDPLASLRSLSPSMGSQLGLGVRMVIDTLPAWTVGMALMKGPSKAEGASFGSSSTIDFPETKQAEYRFAHAKVRLWKGLNILIMYASGTYSPRIDSVHIFLLESDP